MKKYFKGTIAEKKLSDFNQYDNTITKHKDRIKFVKDVLYDGEFIHEFFATYFSQYYDASPNQSGALAEDDSVCKLIDILGTYILNANDVESNRKIEYRFWKDERDFYKSKESQNVNTSALENNEDGNSVEVIDMFVDRKNNRNQKIVGKTSIKSKDIKDIEEIKNIENAIKYLKSDNGIKEIKGKIKELIELHPDVESVSRLEYILNNTERFISLYVKSLKENQVLIKEAVKKPIHFTNILKDSGCDIKWEKIIDINNKKAMTILLECLSMRNLMGNELELLLWDLYEFLLSDKISLSKREKEVVLLLGEGYKQKDIADELKISKQYTSDCITRIIKKIQSSNFNL